jgi:hypothetical protein
VGSQTSLLMKACSKMKLVPFCRLASRPPAKILYKVSFQTGDLVLLFVDPNHAGQLLGDFFDHFSGLIFRIAFEIED